MERMRECRDGQGAKGGVGPLSGPRRPRVARKWRGAVAASGPPRGARGGGRAALAVPCAGGDGGAGGVDAWPPESAAALLTVWGGTRRGLAGHATTGRTPWFRVCKSGDGVVARCRRPRHGAGSQPGRIGWRLGGGGPLAATGWERTRTGRPRSCAAPTIAKLKLFKMHVRHCSDCTSFSFRDLLTRVARPEPKNSLSKGSCHQTPCSSQLWLGCGCSTGHSCCFCCHGQMG